jgi:aconitate hydratase
VELRFGPNIRDWPKMPALQNNLLVKLCAVIEDEVTTTDELIPSGETSSYRSNPEALSEFALSRRVPEYVERSKKIRDLERKREAGDTDPVLKAVLAQVGASAEDTTVGSCIFARKPGDGSAREQAASCQKVLGGFANLCYEFATKRYRSNCINWGILPFTVDRESGTVPGEEDWIYIPDVRNGLLEGKEAFEAVIFSAEGEKPVTLHCGNLSKTEREILADGCLMNWYAAGKGAAYER